MTPRNLPHRLAAGAARVIQWALWRVVDAGDWLGEKWAAADAHWASAGANLGWIAEESVHPVVLHRWQNHGHSSGQLLDGSLYCIDCDWKG